MKLPRKTLFLITAILLAGIFTIWFYGSAKAPGHSQAPNVNSSTNSFDKNRYSKSDPSSIWVVVNKAHALPGSYLPADLTVPNVPLRVPGNVSMQLRQVAAAALEQMFAAAKDQGVSLMLSSGYRSYDYQVNLYNGYVKSQGQAAADTYSARPGHSEHQSGLAADVEPVSRNCELGQCFANTAEGKWLAANAYKYGFIIRYPKGLENITGYEAEPWHVRYVGVDLSLQMHRENIKTLEQFFGISGGTKYVN